MQEKNNILERMGELAVKDNTAWKKRERKKLDLLTKSFTVILEEKEIEGEKE